LRSDKEIKEFIDSREALTQRELMLFMHNTMDFQIRYTRDLKWWAYVLDTKDWQKLKAYKHFKINEKNIKSGHYNEYKKIYFKDERIRNSGVRGNRKLLKSIYDIHVSLSSIKRYRRYIKNEQTTLKQ
jgi:hypothetical protein